MSRSLPVSLVLAAATLTACDSSVAPDTLPIGEGDATKVLDEHGKADSSAEAIFLDFEFDGELVTNFAFNPVGIVEDQLLYTIGHLNGDNSVGRLDRLQVSNVSTQSLGGGRTRIRYHARLPVAWGDKDNVPSEYTLHLPVDMTSQGLEDFATQYGESCVDHGQAHDVDSGNMWYYYRTESFGCSLADEDIVSLTADVSVSDTNTTGKFPEYDKVWEDDTLRVVAVFGKYEDGATSNSDAGIAAYNRFVRQISSELAPHDAVSEPAQLPFNAGIDNPDVAFEATLPDGKEVVVNILLVDNVRTAGATFDARYGALSTRADLIAYNGHAGLGANIRALAGKGEWVTGQYAMMFINGCDTYAYVDSALYDAHAEINADDPTGTKYVDIITNAMPAFFHEVANSTLVLTRGLLSYDDPMTYEQMFEAIDADQVVLVSGEEDNTFVPGGKGGEFETLTFTGSVQREQDEVFSPGMLQPGTYTFTLSHDPANPGGDADLYVRVGAEPTANEWDCRPYAGGSDEVCELTLTEAAQVFALVNGYQDTDNHFVLTIEGKVDGGGVDPQPWDGLSEAGIVARNEEIRFATPVVEAGTYRFDLTGTADADLYVRIGAAPTTEQYDCRPFKTGSSESCVVELPAATDIHVMVRGWANSSSFELEASRQ